MKYLRSGEDGRWRSGTLSLLWGWLTFRKSFNFMSSPIKLISQDCYPFHRRLPAALLKVNLFHENLHRGISFAAEEKPLQAVFHLIHERKHRKCLIEFPLKRNKSKFIQFKLLRHSTFSARCLSEGCSKVTSSVLMHFMNCKFLFVALLLSSDANIYHAFFTKQIVCKECEMF